MALSKIPSAGFQDNVKFRNLVINGDSSIFQRSTSASSLTGSGYHAPDRFRFSKSGIGTWTWSQSTDVPSGQGFAYSQKLDCTTADASPSASSEFKIETRFEGQNLQYLKKGTSSAESLTLSFWVKSSKTGTHIAELQDHDNTRAVSLSYTVNTASTWEKKIITFPPDTTGTLDNDNALSLRLHFWLGAGSNYTSGTLQTTWSSLTNANRVVGQVNLADSTSNEWYITGVQLEAGTSASDFEFLPHDVNLQRCQRYYQTTQSFVGNGSSNTSQCVGETAIGITMRAVPSLSLSGNFVITDGYTSDYTQSSAGIAQYSNSAETRSFMVIIQNLPTLTTAKPYHARHSNSSVIQFSAEL